MLIKCLIWLSTGFLFISCSSKYIGKDDFYPEETIEYYNVDEDDFTEKEYDAILNLVEKMHKYPDKADSLLNYYNLKTVEYHKSNCYNYGPCRDSMEMLYNSGHKPVLCEEFGYRRVEYDNIANEKIKRCFRLG